MLKAGIVGLKKSYKYISVLKDLDNYIYTGIYDPSFQIDLTLYNEIQNGYLEFNELVQNCDLIIFSSDDKVFYPLMREVLCCSKILFLDCIHKLTHEQLGDLSELAYEANSILKVLHADLQHQLIRQYKERNTKPLVISAHIISDDRDSLLKVLREEIYLLLDLANSKPRKIRVNIASSFSSFPDVYCVNIEFNNGCICNIIVNALKGKASKDIEILGVTSNMKIDFLKGTLDEVIHDKSTIYDFKMEDNSQSMLVTRLLESVYDDFIHNNIIYSLDNEMEACKVIDRVTDRLKVCFSLA